MTFTRNLTVFKYLVKITNRLRFIFDLNKHLRLILQLFGYTYIAVA